MTPHPARRKFCPSLLVICLSLFVPFSLIILSPAGAQDKKDDKKVDKKDDKKDDKKQPEKEPEKKEPPKLDTPLKSLKGHTDWINSIAYSQDGKYLASGSRDRTVRVWDPAAGKDLTTLKTQPEKTKGVPGVKAVIFVGPGTRIAATTGRWDIKQKEWRGEIKLWDGVATKELKAFEAHSDTIEALAATRDGKKIASGGEDRLVKIFDVDGGSVLFDLKGHAGQVHAVAFSPDGKLLASGGEDKTEPAKEPKKEPKKEVKKDKDKDKKDKKDKKESDKKESDKKEPPKKDAKDPKEVKKDPQEVKKDPPVPILLWNAETGKDAGTLPGPARAVTCLAFNPDGTRLAAAGLDGTIHLFDVPGKKLLRTLTAHDGVWAVAFSKDGKTLATGGYDWKIKLWDADKGVELRTIVAHNNTVTCLAFSPDGQHLASGGLDQMIRIWSVK
jgi:WD40 repeat protein